MRDLYQHEEKILESEVSLTEIDKQIFKDFDYEFNGKTTFKIPHLKVSEDFQIGVIYGSSGSGKSTLLKQFGENKKIFWDNTKSIASHFESKEEAIDKLSAVGLNSIPVWGKPRNILSNGEGYRADLAKLLDNNIVIDEFTSVVNRDVAKSCSHSLSKYIKKNNLKNIVIATCHDDILEWLEPCWVYQTDAKKFASRGLQRRKIEIDVIDGDRKLWEIFKDHHYLNEQLPHAVRCFLAIWEKKVVGFGASIFLPGKIPPLYEGDSRKKWRGCRTVILPDFQGLGIGTRFSDAIADIHIENGFRYFSKTSHMRMGQYREQSNKWRATSTNLADRSKSADKKGAWSHWKMVKKRICYSHEYIGENNKSYNPKYNFLNNQQKVLF